MTECAHCKSSPPRGKDKYWSTNQGITKHYCTENAPGKEFPCTLYDQTLGTLPTQTSFSMGPWGSLTQTWTGGQ